VTLTNKLERIKIQKLLFYLDKVKKIHEKYMSNGKVFIDTIELRKINEKILVLIIQKSWNNYFFIPNISPMFIKFFIFVSILVKPGSIKVNTNS